MSELYIVGTPIGNLEDITFRAINTLKNVDFIACEDTRKTLKLLQYYNIEKKSLLSCYAHNESSSAQGIIKLLKSNHKIAYCCDAGTPALSDPGARLIQNVLNAGFKVTPIPGVSALTTLMSVAGLNDHDLYFAGFLPQRGAKRTKQLIKILAISSPVLLYESPHRIKSLIEEVATLDPLRMIIVGREMTKMHEEFWRDSADQLAKNLQNLRLIGEFALIISHNYKC